MDREIRFNKSPGRGIHKTVTRPQIANFDSVPPPDRSLVDYNKYHRYIGQASIKRCVSIQATRGCPYQCAYCHKIWPKSHVSRSAQNLFNEIKALYDIGIRRFSFVDDIFNLNIENSRTFFQLIIDNGLQVQLFFSNGLRADLLTGDYIDLMVKAGLTNVGFALETASPRLQKLIRKNLNLDKLSENIHYICREHPHVILELFTMHGFPTETEEEAWMTLEFIKRHRWIHFPYVEILHIFPNTDMEILAIENGVSREAILRSDTQALHQLPDTLPFDKTVTYQYQADFLSRYFLLKERLIDILPHQIEVMTEDEIVQKYNSYLPVDIKRISDLLDLAGISLNDLGGGPLHFPGEELFTVPDLNEKLAEIFPRQEPDEDALRILLLDLSQLYSHESHMLYDVVEPPVGLMYLMTYLKQQFGSKINGKIAKSRIDFDTDEELQALLTKFKPDVIGIRSLSFFKDFFHRTTAMIRQWGVDVPIIAGGPYATSSFEDILKDPGIDLVVLGEGEITFSEVIRALLENNKNWPGEDILESIAGLAFLPG